MAKYGNCGILLLMGNAGSISSAVVSICWNQIGPKKLGTSSLN